MYSNFKEQGIEYARQAVAEDTAGNYEKAYPLYMNALEYFKTHLKYEKNPKIKEAILAKFQEYLSRAEQIKEVIEGSAQNGQSGDAAMAVKPKTGKKGGEKGGDGDDADAAKLRMNLSSAIVREKPNVKWSDVAGLESAKQALQEAVILPVKFPQFFTGKRKVLQYFTECARELQDSSRLSTSLSNSVFYSTHCTTMDRSPSTPARYSHTAVTVFHAARCEPVEFAEIMYNICSICCC